jgi:hypothetical protein
MAVNRVSGMLESCTSVRHNFLKEPEPEHSVLML